MRLGAWWILFIAGALPLSAAVAADPTPAPLALAGRFAHYADHSWLSGRLIRRTVDGKESWRIRYVPEGSPLEAMDSHRGVLALDADARLGGFKDGDWIEITGKPIPPAASRPGGASGVRYALRTVKRVEAEPTVADLTAAQLAELEALFKALGDDEYAVREKAEQAIIKFGIAALPLARKRAGGQDIETAERAMRIVAHFEQARSAWRIRLTASLAAEAKQVRPGGAIQLTVAFDNQDDLPVALAFKDDREAPWQDGAYYELVGPDGKRVADRSAAGFKRSDPAGMARFVRADARREELVKVELLPRPPAGVPAPEQGAAPIGYLVIGSPHTCFPLTDPGRYRLKLRLPVRGDPSASSLEVATEDVIGAAGIAPAQKDALLAHLRKMIAKMKAIMARQQGSDTRKPVIYNTIETAELRFEVKPAAP